MSGSAAHVHPCVIHVCVSDAITALYLHSLPHGYIAPGPAQLAHSTLCNG